jgi:hypothetical protein
MGSATPNHQISAEKSIHGSDGGAYKAAPQPLNVSSMFDSMEKRSILVI